MPHDVEQARWARVLQALWLVAVASAKVRGGVYDALLIPGVSDSARQLIGRDGIRGLLSDFYTLRQESPRRAEAIVALLEQADAKVRWFIEADPSTLPLAGRDSLAVGAELMKALGRMSATAETKRHVVALADTFSVLSDIDPFSAEEAEHIARLRQQTAEQPFNRSLRGELFDKESR